MNKEDYIKQVLKRVIASYFREQVYISPYDPLKIMEFGQILYQEDGNKAHGMGLGKTSLRWLKEEMGVVLFNDELWSPSSPDLSIIENCWRIVKQRIESRAESILKISDLKQAAQVEWDRLEQHHIDNMVASMPSRIKQLQERGGFSTKW